MEAEAFRQVREALACFILIDNTARQQAEVAFNQMRTTNPGLLSVSLAAIILGEGSPSPVEEERQLAATLLCQIVSRHKDQSTWDLLQPQQQETVKAWFLLAMEREKSWAVARKLADCVSTLGGDLVPRQQWPQLLPFLLSSASSVEPITKCAVIDVFGDIALSLGPGAFEQQYSVIYNLLSAALCDVHPQVSVPVLLV